MRQVATIVVALAVLAAPQASAKEPLTPKTVFGLSWNNRQTSFAELDALTLRPVSKSVPLGRPWAGASTRCQVCSTASTCSSAVHVLRALPDRGLAPYAPRSKRSPTSL